MTALLGPCPCQTCGDPLTWYGRYWSDDDGRSVHRCRESKAVAIPCECGGVVIVTSNEHPERDVRRHNDSGTHRAWRTRRETAA